MLSLYSRFFLTGDSGWLTANKKNMWNNESTKKRKLLLKRTQSSYRRKMLFQPGERSGQEILICLSFITPGVRLVHMVHDIFANDNISCITSLISCPASKTTPTCKNPPPPWVVPCQLVALHLSSSIPVFQKKITDFFGFPADS